MALKSRSAADGPTPGSSADQVPEADPVEVARSICLRQLTMGPRTRHQLATALAKRRVDPEVAEQVLDRLEDVCLIDDETYAAMWVRSRQGSRGLSRRALAHELRQRGVCESLVEQALDEVTAEDEYEAARRLVDKKLPSTRALGIETRIRRLVSMLGRKGYSGGMSMRVVREALNEERALTLHENQVLSSMDIALSDAARVGE
jgi:regulatory protein